ncbi:hypothetical protein [Sediminibacillus massiliensis]|uniref:hypothetical protein n=1 Tax=Sediminibacillus massiliensis TaxID=1926277 RepID=UPI00098879C4|nr:hypothetical protein [Sediminibacillus massiliensis]
MYKKVNELITLLEETKKCEVKLINREKHTYFIESPNKIKYRERSKRFGKIHAGEKRLRIDLIFPKGLLTVNDIKDYTNLDEKEEAHRRSSYFELVASNNNYETLAIFISRNQLDDYDFNSEDFSGLAERIVNANAAQ